MLKLIASKKLPVFVTNSGVVAKPERLSLLISWNDKAPKFDIRDWDSEHKKMGKGVTLSVEELKKLRYMLNGMEL